MNTMRVTAIFLVGISLSLSAFALDFEEPTAELSALAEAIADATLQEAAELLAAELLAIDRMDIGAEEKEARMQAAIALVFAAFEGESNALAEALGDALGHGSMQLLTQVESLLGEVGLNAPLFRAAAIAASEGTSAVPPPVTLEESPEPPTQPIPEPPPIAPPYAGQSLT